MAFCVRDVLVKEAAAGTSEIISNPLEAFGFFSLVRKISFNETKLVCRARLLNLTTDFSSFLFFGIANTHFHLSKAQATPNTRTDEAVKER